MKNACLATFLLFVATATAAPRTSAQAGSIEFVARATPSGGLEEPIRGFPFFLLTKSFEDISKEAKLLYPKPDMDVFIDKLKVTKELKAWMKKNHWIRLDGEEFVDKLEVSDVIGVPEFFAAYVERNSGDKTIVFPGPKYKAADRVKDPAKYERMVAEYHAAVRTFLTNNPKSTAGMDLNLEDIDPATQWDQYEAKSIPEIHQKTLALAQSKYVVARTSTDLQGQGFLRGIPAGTYWLSSLDVSADIGDARPRWDTAVTVRPGQTTYVALSSANAISAAHASP
ncbi:MAG: hypothetical protein WB780_01140 [Candidatus Acidiferrales bacterium]